MGKIRPKSGVIFSLAIFAILAAASGASSLLSLDSARNIAITALGIGFIIFVHELGHFLVAKACGVKCEKFYLGFDAYGLYLAKFKWGETEYGIGAVPLGGYVKMLGQDDNVANAEGENERTKIRNADGTVTLDPRSYTAKSVPQRMAIISAGVIMNLIFAVIFASVAFTQGVDYQPCLVGSLSAGGAAWKAGIEPGDRILQFGKEGQPSKHLRFNTDLVEKVYFHDPSIELPVLIEKPSGEQAWVSTQPKRTFDHMTIFGKDYRSRIGVGPMESLQLLAPTPESATKLVGDQAWIASIHHQDRVISVNGTPVQSYVDFSKIALQSPDKPLVLKVERTFDEAKKKLEAPVTAELTVPPTKIKSLGVFFRAGPISAVLKDSIADKAGMAVGDRVTEVNGTAIQNAFLLPEQLSQLAGKETELTVEKNGKPEQTEKIKLTPDAPTRVFVHGIGSEVGIDGLGIAIPLELQVSGISDYLAKQKVELQAGDTIIGFRTEYVDEKGKPDLSKWFMLESAQADGAYISYAGSDPDLKAMHLRVRRGEKEWEVRVEPQLSDYHSLTRLIPFKDLLEVRKTDSWSEALQLGLRETKESMFKVLFFLKKLASLEVSPTKLGGPLTIAYVANSEASQSIPRFLIFLTLISANLAIVNFLPIPVLDGGHMMFLTAEAIRGKPVSESFQIKLTIAGFFFVMGLMLFVISLDVLRFSGVNV